MLSGISLIPFRELICRVIVRDGDPEDGTNNYVAKEMELLEKMLVDAPSPPVTLEEMVCGYITEVEIYSRQGLEIER